MAALADQRPIDPAHQHLGGPPPFATTFGPSVYRCVCGLAFGDSAADLPDEALAGLACARWEHFRSVYRSCGQGWYPGEGTLHSNLHRAVQRVVKEQFTEAVELTEEMVPAVAPEGVLTLGMKAENERRLLHAGAP